MSRKKKFYFNTRTGTVEQGKRFSWVGRLGPYATRAEAERALETAANRTEAWDEADRAKSRESEDD